MRPDDPLGAWIDDQTGLGRHPREIAADVGRWCADQLALGADGAPALLESSGSERPRDLTDAVFGPSDVIMAYERAQSDDDRYRHGVHYTPVDVALRLSDITLDRSGVGPVCDPSVGGGAFLLGAAEALVARGLERGTIVAEYLWGIDIDQGAVVVAQAALSLWASIDGEWHCPTVGHLVVADTLVTGLNAFDAPPEDGFRAVVGNPPFQGQLGSATARSPEVGAELRRRWDTDAGPYADTAAFFLLAGASMLAEGGVITLVQPRSLLASTDAAPIRDALDDSVGLVGMWIADRGVFEADVEVCAPVLGGGAPKGSVLRWSGPELTEQPSVDRHGEPWAALAAAQVGAPHIKLSGRRLGERASATAGFRDQFYGLAAHTFEAGEIDGPSAPLVTVGMIDPLHCRWGSGTFRFAGKKWCAPVIDLDSLGRADPRLRRWVDDRLHPKVLLATQTRVLEVVADPDGRLVPSTPVISVECEADDVWKLAAALSSPALTAMAFGRAAGAAMSAGTLKLSARQVLDLVEPSNGPAWELAAEVAREAQEAVDPKDWEAALARLATATNKAYGLDDSDIEAWWIGRLPGWR